MPERRKSRTLCMPRRWHKNWSKTPWEERIRALLVATCLWKSKSRSILTVLFISPWKHLHVNSFGPMRSILKPMMPGTSVWKMPVKNNNFNAVVFDASTSHVTFNLQKKKLSAMNAAIKFQMHETHSSSIKVLLIIGRTPITSHIVLPLPMLSCILVKNCGIHSACPWPMANSANIK